MAYSKSEGKPFKLSFESLEPPCNPFLSHDTAFTATLPVR